MILIFSPRPTHITPRRAQVQFLSLTAIFSKQPHHNSHYDCHTCSSSSSGKSLDPCILRARTLTRSQIIFSAITLALAAVLLAQYGPGHAPSLFSYGAFCGAASILISFVGVAACFVDKLQGILMLALDGLATFFLFAGGLVGSFFLRHRCR